MYSSSNLISRQLRIYEIFICRNGFAGNTYLANKILKYSEIDLCFRVSRKQLILISLTTMTVLAAVALAVAITFYCFKHKKHSHGVPTSPNAAEMYQHGAVAADAVTCSEIGKYKFNTFDTCYVSWSK